MPCSLWVGLSHMASFGPCPSGVISGENTMKRPQEVLWGSPTQMLHGTAIFIYLDLFSTTPGRFEGSPSWQSMGRVTRIAPVGPTELMGRFATLVLPVGTDWAFRNRCNSATQGHGSETHVYNWVHPLHASPFRGGQRGNKSSKRKLWSSS